MGGTRMIQLQEQGAYYYDEQINLECEKKSEAIFDPNFGKQRRWRTRYAGA